MRYVMELTGSHAPANSGRKSENLHWLIRRQLRVPRTFVVTWEAFQKYRAQDPALIPDLQKELESCLDLSLHYAVRSSANVEDARERSFAGQFETVLNACGSETILQAIRSVWDKAQNVRIQSYASSTPTGPGRTMTLRWR